MAIGESWVTIVVKFVTFYCFISTVIKLQTLLTWLSGDWRMAVNFELILSVSVIVLYDM